MTTIGAAWHSGALVPSTTPGQPAELDPREHTGWDIHVLRGTTSLPLLSILVLGEDNGNFTRADAANLPADVTRVSFFPRFASTAPFPASVSGGVSVNRMTGEVTATAPAPAPPRMRTFVIDPIVGLTGGGAIQAPPIRFHIHESVTEIWLTPSPLTIAGDADGQRFTVLARFDDNTIGDITYLASAPPAAGQPPTPGFTWRSNDNVCAQPDARGGLAGVFGLFACTSTITVTLRQPGWPTLSASADVNVVEEWGNQPADRRDLHLLSGPGVTAVGTVPNFLFLPDGFLDTQQDRDDFFALAGLAVQRLNRSFSTVPFDILEHTINYWAAFVPSRERGTSTLDDLAEETTLFETSRAVAPNVAPPTVAPVTSLNVDGEHPVGASTVNFEHTPLTGGQLPAGVHVTISGQPTVYTTTNAVVAGANKLRGVKLSPPLTSAAHAATAVTVIGRRASVPRGQQPNPNAVAWSILDLIGTVGLPTPAEGLTAPSTAAQLAAKITEWQTLYGAAFVPNAIVNGNHPLYDAWALGLSLDGAHEMRLPDHRLADEKDTAFGLATGERPREQVRAGEQVITWHPLRTQRSHVDLYLATLAFQGTVIGTTWVAHTPTGPAKDASLVFILARGARYSGTNRGGPEPIIAMGLVDDLNVRAVYGPGRSVQIASHPMPRDAANAPRVTGFVHSTIAHEAAHSFHILDEYTTGRGTLQANNTIAERTSFGAGNVTTATEAVGAGGLVGERLRWRWARIVKAGVLAGPPVPVAGQANTFTIHLVPGLPGNNIRGDAFDPNDVVFLRQRQLVRPPAGNPLTFTAALETGPLSVSMVISPTELQVVGALNPNDFMDVGVNAPILFNPLPASATAAAAGDRYAEVMAQFIRAHLTTSGGPLNAPAATPRRACAPAGAPTAPQAATNLPAPAPLPNQQFPAIRSRIIGAYEGGMEFDCGVFHPAGSCIMRSPLATANETAITGEQLGDVHAFCHVCRYLIVDHIDPRRHFHIDFLYHDYPQP